MHRVLCLLLLIHSAVAFHDEYDSLQCTLCPETGFCTEGLLTPCPEHSRSDPANFPAGVEDCVCLPGYLRQGDNCSTGGAPYWYHGGILHVCNANRETSAPLASSELACVCSVGFVGPPGALECVRCSKGTYNPSLNSTICTSCPEHSDTGSAGESALTACTCNAGHAGSDGGPCLACVAGSYKAVSGNSSCAACPANTFSGGAAAACDPCPANSSSAPGAAAVFECLCAPGYQWTGAHCAPCGGGLFKGSTGNVERCTVCELGTYTDTVASASCLPCRAHSESISSRRECVCSAGYFTEGAECVACPVHTYQQSTNASECVACDENAQSPAASDRLAACHCNAGYFEADLGACLPCLNDTYKDWVDDETQGCAACPPHAESAPGSLSVTACRCRRGFTGEDGGPCVACPLGTYKAAAGDEGCELCPADTFNDEANASSCQACTPNALAPAGSASAAACACDWRSGYGAVPELPDLTCALCPAGSAATASGCEPCAQGSYSMFVGSTACAACHADASSYELPRIDCQCNRGFYLEDPHANAPTCVACNSSSFKESTGNQSCTPCHAHSQALAGSVSQTACQCELGFYRQSTFVCTACAPGSYSAVLDAETCAACPYATFTDQRVYPWIGNFSCQACTLCPQDTFDAARGGLGCGESVDADCQLCPVTTGTLPPLPPDTLNRGEGSCRCLEDYYGPPGGQCASCTDIGKVRPLGVARENTTVDDCLCPEGLFDSAGACAPCEVGTYKPGIGNGACTQCPPTLTTEGRGSVLLESCVCAAGYLYSAEACAECPRDTYKAAYDRAAQCTPCTPNSTAAVASVNASDCQCLPGFYLLGAECVACAPGAAKSSTGNEGCAECAVDTFSPVAGAVACTVCGPWSSTLNGTGHVACVCDLGFSKHDTVDGECALCAVGSYRDLLSLTACLPCSSCRDNELVAAECVSTSDIRCSACPPNSWSLPNRTTRGLCYCNSGYELAGSGCVACGVGKSRMADANNSIVCQTCSHGKFTPTPASSECEPCTDTCSAQAYGEFVAAECNATRDIVCEACRVCGPGEYANRTCGDSFLHDRRDTECVLCAPNFFCPGGAESQAQLECRPFSSSRAGSFAPSNCTCWSGYHDVAGVCTPCAKDTYCPGDERAYVCPNHSFSFAGGSSHRLDCQCYRQYYREPADSYEAFECNLCTPNDYCYNNTRFNCSDERMLSDVGSGYFANCTCMDGYYNNGTECAECSSGSFCVDGVQRPCPEHEWTNGAPGQDSCVCEPAYYRAASARCELCFQDSYCPGTNDLQIPCAQHSTAPNGSREELACECLPGFENATHGGAHVCLECPQSFFKDDTGNVACRACTVCRASEAEYELQACRSAHDAACDACRICNTSTYTAALCTDLTNTACLPCSECDYAHEYLSRECSPGLLADTQCRPFSTTLDCATGYYRGLHGPTQDSACYPCRFRDTLLIGQQLHTITSQGQVYNDMYSCDIMCLGYSRLVSVANTSLGCVSCETGNVLLKQIVVHWEGGLAVNCSFSCRGSFTYDAQRDDCYAPALQASARNAFTHSLNVTQFRRTAGGITFTVAHTNHSFFVVLAGPSPGIACSVLTRSACCFGDLWRVSTPAQMGLLGNETCSRRPELQHAALYPDVLEFEVADRQFGQVMNCSAQDERGTTECVMWVTLLDVVLWQHVSVSVQFSTTRTVQYVRFNNFHRYIPLADFQVDAFLLRTSPTANVYQVYMQATPLLDMNISVFVSGMTAAEDSEQQLCSRLSQAPSTQHYTGRAVYAPKGAPLALSSVWHAPAAGTEVRAFFQLDLLDAELDTMDIAAIRNMSGIYPMCQESASSTTYEAGNIFAAWGLGAESVGQLQHVPRATALTHGETGTLLTLFVQATTSSQTAVRLQSLLAAHVATPPVQADMAERSLNATALSHGVVDFTYEFRRWCRLQAGRCWYEYIARYAHPDAIFQMSDCGAGSKQAARQWLLSSFGLAEDAGHVDAMCANSDPEHASLIVMVHPMIFTPRNDGVWDVYQNKTLGHTKSYVWVSVEFT